MKPNLVVDIGNSRIKWGYCADDRVLYRASLPADEPSSWEDQIKRWDLGPGLQWAMATVNPCRSAALAEWVNSRSDRITMIQDRSRLPIKIEMGDPDRVGMDRLLNAVAAKNRVQRKVSIIIIDAGSAVTIDWVDEDGAFRGGAIFPGLRLMAKALHDYTAALPLVEIATDPPSRLPSIPSTFTDSAIKGGIFWALAGGIKGVTRQLIANAGAVRDPVIYLTGGDAKMLATVLDAEVELWPTMTLEGVRLAAEALP
jgi:type III pantothenate kinase